MDGRAYRSEASHSGPSYYDVVEIDQRTIPDAMVWRHLDATIDDLRHVAGSFNTVDVHRLSAHVIKLMDMPEGVLVLSGLSRVWKSRVCNPVLQGADRNGMGAGFNYFVLCPWPLLLAFIIEEPHLDVRPTLQRLPFYCTPPAAAAVVIPGPTLEDLVVGTPSSKIVAKAEAFQKRKASTSDSRGKGVMVDDAAAPSAGVSQPRPSSEPAPSFMDFSGDCIHTDFFPFSVGPYYATCPEDGVAGNCEFTREEWDAPHRPTFGLLTKEVFKDLGVCKTIVDQFPTPREMVRVESLYDDQLTAKISVLHYMMMLHGGELLARYHWLNQSHHEYLLSTDSRLKGYEEKVANMTGFKLQASALKKQVSGLNDKLSSSDASFAKSNAKGKERKKKIKSLTKSLDNLHTEVARLSVALNQATILEAERDEEILRLKTTPPEIQGELLSLAASAGFDRGFSMHQTKDEFAVVLKNMVNFMPGAQDRLAEASPHVAQTDYAFLNKISEHAAKPLLVILQLEPKKLVRPTNVPTPRDSCISPPVTKDSTVTPASKSLELSANVDLTASIVASEHNEEMVTVEVDGSDPKMIDDTINC
ncbi:hypothetical protein Tco_1319849 [Tanacetum coccineum]